MKRLDRISGEVATEQRSDGCCMWAVEHGVDQRIDIAFGIGDASPGCDGDDREMGQLRSGASPPAGSSASSMARTMTGTPTGTPTVRARSIDEVTASASVSDHAGAVVMVSRPGRRPGGRGFRAALDAGPCRSRCAAVHRSGRCGRELDLTAGGNGSVLQVPTVGVGAIGNDHEHDLLAPLPAGHADRCGVTDVGVGDGNVLDLPGDMFSPPR